MFRRMSEENESKDVKIESKKAQENIKLLKKPDDDKVIDSADLNSVYKTETNMSKSITVSIANTSPLNICHVSLTDTGMILESSDILPRSLDGTSSIQLEDGTTAFVQSFEHVDEPDSGDATTRFIDGQAVQLEDGSTAFIHTTPREGLQPVQLEDGTMAYLSQSGAELFNGEASTLDLENLSASQLTDPEIKDLELKVDNYSKGNSTRVAEKAFQCEYPDCKRLYTTLHHLKVHERSHTGDRPFKCASCPKAFATGYGLKSHTRVHTGETPYKCPDEGCHKAFKTSGDLQKHVRTHTGERPFKCPYNGCDRAFTTSNIRKVHIRTHTGERPYICKEGNCGRAFASATNYKNHIRIHTGEKPYLCSVPDCNKRFTEYSSLYKHHVVHTHSKPYTCNLCGKNYRQTSTLAMHKRTAHGIVEQSDVEQNKNEIVTPDIRQKVKKPQSAHDEDAHAVQTVMKQEKDNNEVNIKEETEEMNPPLTKPVFHRIISLQKDDVSQMQQEDMKETARSKATFQKIVSFPGGNASEMLQEHSVYTVQLQDEMPSNMQQIVLVADSSQLATLQLLAEQGQLGTVISAVATSS